MSPFTRRDLLTRSVAAAAAVAAMPALASSTSVAQGPISARSSDRHFRDMRKAEFIGVIRNTETGQRTICTVFMDGDIDGSWTVSARPVWREYALVYDDDATGYHRTSDHTADSILDATWDSLFEPTPHVLAATPFHGFADLWDDPEIPWHHNWWSMTAEGTWMARYPWKSAEEVATAIDWHLVTNRPDVMERFPGYNAIIMCMGRFYLAVLEGGAQ